MENLYLSIPIVVVLQIHENMSFIIEGDLSGFEMVFFNLDSSRLYFSRLRLNSKVFTPANFDCTFQLLEKNGDSIKKYKHIRAIRQHDEQFESNFACGYVFDRGPKENTIGRAARMGLKTTGPG